MGQMSLARSASGSLLAPSLGSCLALCLFSPSKRVVAMAHIVLPTRSRTKLAEQAENSSPCKYADESLAAIFTEMARKYGDLQGKDFSAKIIGGAQLFKGGAANTLYPTIGQQNIQMLLKDLCKRSITISGCDVGGEAGRSVRFDTETGDVHIRRAGHTLEIIL